MHLDPVLLLHSSRRLVLLISTCCLYFSTIFLVLYFFIFFCLYHQESTHAWAPILKLTLSQWYTEIRRLPICMQCCWTVYGGIWNWLRIHSCNKYQILKVQHPQYVHRNPTTFYLLSVDILWQLCIPRGNLILSWVSICNCEESGDWTVVDPIIFLHSKYILFSTGDTLVLSWT